jgi:hypothetical protein
VFRAIGTPVDVGSSMVEASFSYDGSLYHCSAAMGVEAALVILGYKKAWVDEIGGGILTPSTLGMQSSSIR